MFPCIYASPTILDIICTPRSQETWGEHVNPLPEALRPHVRHDSPLPSSGGFRLTVRILHVCR